ncbi:unnamed protein product [Notodromas monacha]|uniref:Fibronectin type-III domain-containing protein n=1 Tax=Notodromas monacha TaxID=399045 RepID=A0A7R9BI02_9CRUS|nr:unnamed protein product [Notodromas monacha]CAG0914478.1 unnamed protein product [Notodromas monacha]
MDYKGPHLSSPIQADDALADQSQLNSGNADESKSVKSVSESGDCVEKNSIAVPTPDMDSITFKSSAKLENTEIQTPVSNALATLAAEAVKAAAAPSDEGGLVQASDAPKLSGGAWHSVGIFSGNSCKVTGYTTQDLSEELSTAHFDISKLPAEIIDETAVQKLEPGEFYRVRVCAFNSCGFGPWSEATTFRTTVPGFPNPPSGVKITSTKEGVHLSWHPPQDNADEVMEYSVYLAVKGQSSEGANVISAGKTNQAFKRVYIGAASSCLVPSAVLTDAHMTNTTPTGASSKPAILFRIAARNKKGYGPSIQVRWIQGEAVNQNAARRTAAEDSAGAAKKKRKE